MTPTAVTLVVCFIGIVVLAVIASGCQPENENNDATPKGTLEITQTFEGLKDGIIPTEYVLGLFTEDTSKKQHSSSYDFSIFLPEGTRYVFYNNYEGKFQLNKDYGENVQLEQLWDGNSDVCGFKWKLTDLPIGTYHVEMAISNEEDWLFTGCVPGYHRKGSKVNGGELKRRPESIPVTIETNTLTTLSLTEVYEPNRVLTRKEKAALEEGWRAEQALLKQHNDNKIYAELK